MQTIDAATDKLQKSFDKKEPMKNLKGTRYMRQIAEAAGADDEILVLLPKPKMSEGKVAWTSGQEIADVAAEKARKKAEKEAKKAAKLEAKKKKEAEKRAKAAAKAEKKNSPRNGKASPRKEEANGAAEANGTA